MEAGGGRRAGARRHVLVLVVGGLETVHLHGEEVLGGCLALLLTLLGCLAPAKAHVFKTTQLQPREAISVHLCFFALRCNSTAMR